MCLIVGLGNPGKKYDRTRHNVGFLVLDQLADMVDGKFKNKRELNAAAAEVIFGNKKVVLLKPQTFMNLSGEAVGGAAQFWHIPKEKITVIFDDANLPIGKIRVRTSGSAGGHNGMKSIIEKMGTDEIRRIRIGIGRPAESKAPLDKWVLGKWSKAEWKEITEAAHKVAKMVTDD
ncbi:MAG: aminoacyl-tRNA hydrolase [Patescibacteria group bacterium]|jgi:PTH1 family peptidyl-tRNA hydrolase